MRTRPAICMFQFPHMRTKNRKGIRIENRRSKGNRNRTHLTIQQFSSILERVVFGCQLSSRVNSIPNKKSSSVNISLNLYHILIVTIQSLSPVLKRLQNRMPAHSKELFLLLSLRDGSRQYIGFVVLTSMCLWLKVSVFVTFCGSENLRSQWFQ